MLLFCVRLAVGRGACFAVLVFALFGIARAEGLAPNSVRVGLILPLSGAHAESGEQMRNAAILARELLPDDLRGRLELLFEDDQFKAEFAIRAFHKFVEVDRADAIVCFGGQSVAVLAPLATQKQVVLMGLTADSSLFRGFPYAFQHWLSSQEQSRAVFGELDKQALRSVALVSTAHNAALDIRDKFEASAVAKQMSIVLKADFLPGDTDFRGVLNKIRSARPDAVLTVLVAPHMSLFMRQMRDLKIEIPVYSSANAEILSEVQSAAGAMEGVRYAAADLDPAFIKTYENRFGRYPEFAAPHIFDSVGLIAHALLAGASRGPGIRERLVALDVYKGAMGQYQLKDGYRFAMRAVAKRIVNGKFEPIPSDPEEERFSP